MIFNKEEIAKTVAARIVHEVDANPEKYAEQYDEDLLVSAAVYYVTDGVKELNFHAVRNLIQYDPEIELALQVARGALESYLEYRSRAANRIIQKASPDYVSRRDLI